MYTLDRLSPKIVIDSKLMGELPALLPTNITVPTVKFSILHIVLNSIVAVVILGFSRTSFNFGLVLIGFEMAMSDGVIDRLRLHRWTTCSIL